MQLRLWPTAVCLFVMSVVGPVAADVYAQQQPKRDGPPDRGFASIFDGRTLDDQGPGFNPFCFYFNGTGNSAASIPCGFTAEGMPVGLQIAARHEDEETIIAASAAFEEAQPWAGKRPPIS